MSDLHAEHRLRVIEALARYQIGGGRLRFHSEDHDDHLTIVFDILDSDRLEQELAQVFDGARLLALAKRCAACPLDV